MSKVSAQDRVLPTASQVRELFVYDPDTGVFTYRVTRRGLRKKVGDVAGYRDPRHGYVYLCINSYQYLGHRIAWLYVYGEWPPEEIDHADGDGANNRIANLRLASHAENLKNRKMDSDNRTGLKGVYFHKKANRFAAQIRCDGKSHYLGLHDTAEAAHEAYVEAAKRLHGKFARAA